MLSLLAASHFHRQEWALAAEKFAESVEVLQMLPAVVPYSYASLAAAQLQLGQLAEAAQTAELGIMTMSLLEHRGPYAASVWQVQAEVAQALGNDEGARVALRRAVDILRQRLLLAPTEHARRTLLQGVLHHRRTVSLCKALFGEDLLQPPLGPSTEAGERRGA